MRFQTINPPQQDRYAPYMQDHRLWTMVQNGETSAVIRGNPACFAVAGSAVVTYTGPAAIKNATKATALASRGTGSASRNAGYVALLPDATNAPLQCFMGLWHDPTNAAKFGKVQCYGWDDDALVKGAATSAIANGIPAEVATGTDKDFLLEVAAGANHVAIITDVVGQTATNNNFYVDLGVYIKPSRNVAV
jgi:hypothetical protein